MLMKYEKRPYQEKAIEKTLEALRNTQNIHVLHLATGAGKTYIAARIIKEIISNQKRIYGNGTKILWISKWELIDDAIKTLRDVGISKGLCLFSDSNPHKINLPKFDKWGEERKIVFSTIETAKYDDDNWKRFRDLKPTLTIIDEFHYGENGSRRSEFDDWALKSGHVIGLTATPHNTFDPIVKVTFKQLAYGSTQYLARPIEPRVDTGYMLDWDTGNRDDSEFNDDSVDALVDLSNDKDRNKRIVSYLIQNQNWLGKTLVFAATTDHAKILYRKMKSKVTVDFALAERSSSENRKALEDFKRRNGGIRYLICVRKYTHGLDIPHIKSIVITRPTKSPKLYRQMIGRGCRLDRESGKDEFFVVEFTDNWRAHGGISKEDYGMPNWYSPNRNVFDSQKLKVSNSIKAHEFEKDHFSIYGDEYHDSEMDVDGPSKLLSLPIRRSQTFGFEFEFAQTINKKWVDPEKLSEGEWRSHANRIRSTLAEVFGANVIGRPAFFLDKENKDHRKWNIDYDGSCGWEVTSRILREFDGVSELRTALSSLSRICSLNDLEVPGLFRTNHRTGVHLHLGYSFSDTEHLKTFLKLVRYLEPGLATLLAPSRLVQHRGYGEYNLKESNEFCRCLIESMSNSEIERIISISEFKKNVRRDARRFDDDPRYRSVNLLNFSNGADVLEIRLFQGSLDQQKIVLWLSIWMQILAASESLKFKDIPNWDIKAPLIPNESDAFDLVLLWRKLGLDHLDSGNTITAIEVVRRQQLSNWMDRGLISKDTFQKIAKRWKFDP
ncbi:MAG: DEAD/DEAH box helicase family protein [Oligoflexia bacterium]|nr:DEAD/DEAH box helicase family protein [Oligoflexia bacterium]